jgi:hypothetical protein
LSDFANWSEPKKISSEGKQLSPFLTVWRIHLFTSAMPLNTVGIGGILLTMLAVLDAEHSVGDNFIPLIGLVMLWFDFTSLDPQALGIGYGRKVRCNLH